MPEPLDTTDAATDATADAATGEALDEDTVAELERVARVQALLERMVNIEARIEARFAQFATEPYGDITLNAPRAAGIAAAVLSEAVAAFTEAAFDETYYTFESALKRYEGTPVPPCRLCGGPLTVGSAGGGNATVYACADAGIGASNKYDMEHYSASRYTHYNPGDQIAFLLMKFVDQFRHPAPGDAAAETTTTAT